MPPLNAMQANAGFMPYGTPDLPPLVFPMGAPGAVASPGQVSAMLQQQMYAQQYAAPTPSMMMGGTMMQSPFRGGFGGPPAMFGRANMARQAGISAAGTAIGGMEAAATVASVGLGMIPGIGIPLGLGVDAISSAAFGAINGQRERALALQNQSLGYVFGGNMLSQTGQGMGMQQARMISSGLGRMADSSAFKQETGGMLNRADLDRLTRIAGETGMLNNTQSPQQVLDAVRKISKQVTTFMSVLEEPDFQRAMQRMGQLHQIGVRIGDMGMVAANTRTFARMAGVTADQAMDTAMQHAQSFQQRGLSAANGINASLGAQGFGRQIASVLDNRTLSMMGGVEGVQNNLMQTTANTFSNPLLMASVLSRGENGRLHASGADFLRAISGPNASIFDITRRGASNLRRLGGRRAISEVLANQDHLRDEMMDELLPEQLVLANIRMAQLQQHQAGGSLEENIMRMTGSEEQTRAHMTLVRDPRAMASLREQGRIAGRDRAVGRRDRQLENQSRWMQRAWDENVANPIGHSLGGIADSIGRWSATNQERAESLALQGNGRARALDGDNFATDVFTASVRDGLSATGAAGAANRARRNAMLERARLGAARENQENLESNWGALGGARGFGFTAAQRGGDSLRQTVLDGGSFGQRYADSFLANFTPNQERVSVAGIERMARSQIDLADVIARGSGDSQSRTDVRNEALNALGEGNRGSVTEAITAASTAARSYFGSREGLFGTQGSLGMDGMRASVRAALIRRGRSEQEADRLVANQDFMATVTANVLETGSAEAVRQLNRATQQGATVRDSRSGQTSSQLRDIVASERGKMRDVLGLSGGPFGMGQASDEYVGALSDVLTDTGDAEKDELRRKLFTAYAMSRSSDAATAERGNRELDRLKSEHPEAQEILDREVRARVDTDEGAREDLADSFRGKTFAEAMEQTRGATENLNSARAATETATLQNVLGDEGAATYGSEGDIGRLRRNAGNVKSRRIRRMLEGSASDEDIRSAIQEEARNGAAAASRSGSVGAGEDESETQAATDDMITDIQEGLAQFPEATENLSSAATALRDASRALQAAAEIGGISAAFSRAG